MVNIKHLKQKNLNKLIQNQKHATIIDFKYN